jgi:hypothetical protein
MLDVQSPAPAGLRVLPWPHLSLAPRSEPPRRGTTRAMVGEGSASLGGAKPFRYARDLMAKKNKGSKGRAASVKQKAPVAAPKRGAAKKAIAPKKAAAPKKAKKKAAARKKAAAPKKATAPEKAAKSVAAPRKKRAPAAAKVKVSPVRRRDGAGHLDAAYAAMLREKSLEGRTRDSDEAFIGRSGHSSDNLAEAMGETLVLTATSGEDENEDVFNQDVPEDAGGPFVTTTAGQEFAEGTDASNPKRSKREAFPKT